MDYTNLFYVIAAVLFILGFLNGARFLSAFGGTGALMMFTGFVQGEKKEKFF